MAEQRWYAKPHGRSGWTWGIDGIYAAVLVVMVACLIVSLVLTGAALL